MVFGLLSRLVGSSSKVFECFLEQLRVVASARFEDKFARRGTLGIGKHGQALLTDVHVPLRRPSCVVLRRGRVAGQGRLVQSGTRECCQAWRRGLAGYSEVLTESEQCKAV
jgi:hypothetical protein